MGEILDALNEEMPPIRERLYGSITAWGGTAKELLEDARGGRLEVRDRAFAQGWLCSHCLSAPTRVMHILDASFICHTPIGCTCFLSQFYGLVSPKMEVKELPGFKPQWTPSWYGTNLTEEDVVFGGEDKLTETIIQADQEYHPKSIWVTKSCSAGMIGDDVEGVVKAVQPQVKATLVPIHCEPIRSRLGQSGWDAFSHAVLRYLVKEPRKKHDDLVNFVVGGAGVRWMDVVYLKSLLAKVGLRVNFVPYFAITEQLETLAEAALSIALCPPATDYLIRGLEEKYGVPYIKDVVPFGIAKTEEWLREIGKLTHRDKQMEKLIEKERTTVMPEVSKLKERLQGVRVFVSGGPTRAFHLPYMLVGDFGMKLVGTNTFEFGDNEVKPLENLGQLIGNLDFIVHVADCQSFEAVNYLKKLDVDLYLGHRGLAACTFKGGILTYLIMQPRHNLRKDLELNLQMGFKGVVSYGKGMARILRNPSFAENLSAHADLPFKDSWYKQDPFSQIVKPLM